MATEAQLKTALINADKAGDTDAARKLAHAIKTMRAERQPESNPKTNDSYALNTAREGIQGMTLGFSDEIGAGMAALAASMTSDAKFTDAYNDIVKHVRNEQNAFREENPKTAMAAQLVGGLATGGAGFAKFGAKQAATNIGRVLPNVAVGAVEGGIAGAGFEDENKLEGAAKGAVTGAIVGGAIGEAANHFQKNSALKKEITELFAKNPSDVKLVNYMQQGSKVVKDKAAEEAIRQGYDKGVIQAVKVSSNKDKVLMQKMVDVLEKGKQNSRYGAVNRPSDIVGDSLARRVKFIEGVNRKAGQEVKRAANGLRGQKVDFNPAVDNFLADLAETGVKFDPVARSVSFKGSDFQGIPGAENSIKRLLARMIGNHSPDAFEVHQLKKFLDENINFGKQTEGMSGKVERLMSNLRTNIDAALDQKFKAYDVANTKFSETKAALDDFQKSVGKSIDFQSENLDKMLGTSARRFLSNVQARGGLLDSLQEIEQVAAKNGAKFDDDVITQALFADELNSVFGSSARTSLQGETAKAGKQGLKAAASGGSIREAAVDAIAEKIDGFRGIDEESAIKAIREVLKRQSKSSKTASTSTDLSLP